MPIPHSAESTTGDTTIVDRHLSTLSLCSGIGGLDLGVGLALDLAGTRHTALGYCERQARAAATLLARMEDAALARGPVWLGDLADIPRADIPAANLLVAGIPCQPFSVAGSRRGTADARWLWPDALRILDASAARLLFLENVPGIIKHGLPTIIDDLAARGFDAEWSVLTAQAVGAPHVRERCFLLAWHVSDAGRDSLRLLTERGQSSARSPEPRHALARHMGAETVGHTDRARLEGRQQSEPEGADERPTRPAGPALDDSHSGRPESIGLAQHTDESRARGYEPHGRSDDRFQLWPPAPDDAAGWQRWLSEGGPQPAIRSSPDGPSRELGRSSLEALGNAVVPLQAAVALRALAARALSEPE